MGPAEPEILRGRDIIKGSYHSAPTTPYPGSRTKVVEVLGKEAF